MEFEIMLPYLVIDYLFVHVMEYPMVLWRARVALCLVHAGILSSYREHVEY